MDKTNGCSGPPGGTLGGAWAPQAELVSTVLEARRCTGHSLDAYCVPGPHVSPGGGPRDGLSRSPGWVWDLGREPGSADALGLQRSPSGALRRLLATKNLMDHRAWKTRLLPIPLSN